MVVITGKDETMLPPDSLDYRLRRRRSPIERFSIAGLLRCKWHRADVAARACQKDRQAFTLLYEYYKQPIGRRLMALVNNRETADDLYQETFVRVWQRATPAVSGKFTQWVYTVASNLAIDYFRHSQRLKFVPLYSEEFDQEDSYEAIRTDWELDDWDIDRMLLLKEAIANMTPQYRVCLLLRRHWGFDDYEIARWLDISPKAVSSNVSRGYKQFLELFLEKNDSLRPKQRYYSQESTKKKIPSLKRRVIRDYVIPDEPPVISEGLSPRLIQLWQEEDRRIP